MKINYTELLQNAGFENDQITKFMRLLEVKKARTLTQNERQFYNRCLGAARAQQVVEEKLAKVAREAKTRMENKVIHRWAVAELLCGQEATGQLFPGEITNHTIIREEYKLHLEELNPVGDQIDVKARFKYCQVWDELTEYVAVGLFDGARKVEFDGELYVEGLRDAMGTQYKETWTEGYKLQETCTYAFDEVHAAAFRQAVKEAFTELGKTAWVSLRVA